MASGSSGTSDAEENAGNDMESDLEEEEEALQYTGRKLYEQLQGGFHGCTDEMHHDARGRHMEEAGDNHYGLGQLFNEYPFPSVLGLSEMITPERLSRQDRGFPSQWAAMFEGIPQHGRQRLPMNVCLHEETTQAIPPDAAFDIDSFLGFATSLGVARKGLWYQPAPQMRQNMTTDVHIETQVYEGGGEPEQPTRVKHEMLKNVPHFLLGRPMGAHDITLFVLFPHIDVLGDKFHSLTHDQFSRWTDNIYMPAIHKFYKAHYTQHLPASYRSALDDSKAGQVESRQIQTASYQTQQSIGYHLQPEHLDDIWQDILQTIQTPGFGDFRDPELFFSAKGTKLQFKTNLARPTLFGAMEYFQSYIEDTLDFDHVQRDRFYVDLGKEVCAQTSVAPIQRLQFGEEPQVYLWKRCCLETYMGWMYEGHPPPKGGKAHQYFTQNMLYDAGSLTSITPRRSKHREGGLIYSQFYSSVKELYDATKTFPFANDAMEELALDPQIRTAARNAAGSRRRDAKIIENGYLAAKKRTRHALRDANGKSFGIREEHRITWFLYLEIMSRLQTHEAEERDDCPPHAWAVKTLVYLEFLWRSADKFATGFEVVRALADRQLVTWEETKMMAMFLRNLRYVFGGHLISRESPLWWSRREGTVGEPARLRVWYGLGFSNTLPAYKYCWIEPRIDWGVLQFNSDLTDEMLFGNDVLRGQYLKRGGQVQAFFDTTRRLELAMRWLTLHHETPAIKDRMLSWAVHIVLQQFRQDILHALASEIVEDRREEVLQGEKGFSLDYLEEIMANGCYLMSGNKTDFKRVSFLFDYLFGYQDERPRLHWEKKQFRVLYRRARTGIRRVSPETETEFVQRLFLWIPRYHWILPYPCYNALLQTTKEGRRMWYSIRKVDDAVSPEDQWEWGKKQWQRGKPEKIPGWVAWSKEEWDDWIERTTDDY